MAVEALCPTCGAVFSLKEDYLGKKVRCKKCEQVFTVAEQKTKGRDETGAVQAAGATAPKKSTRDDDDDDRETRRPAAKRSRDDDDDDDRPRKRASRRSRDDDDDEDDGDRPKGKRRKRVYHDDDEDDEPRHPSRKSSSGGSGKVVAIVGAILVVLLLVCGGAVWGIYRVVSSAAEDIDDQIQQAVAEAAKQDPNIGDFPGLERQPKSLDEALTNLKSATPSDRRGAANWLAKQPLDQARRKEVATALEPLVKETDDNSCASGARALTVWGTRDNGEALTTALKQRAPDRASPFLTDARKELMGAIAQVKYEPGADAILPFLANAFGNAEAEKALDGVGKGAEKSVVKYYNHADGGARERARRLIQRYGTGPDVVLDQVVQDVGSAEQERAKSAVDWLSKTTSDDALAFTKTQPARRIAVAVALNRLIDSPPSFSEGMVFGAVRRWGTNDNIPALIRTLTSSRFKREAADALIALGPACEAEVKKLLSSTDRNLVQEAKRILDSIGSADAKFVAAIEDLKSDDRGRIQQAARMLQAAAVVETQRAAVVVALMGTIRDTGVNRGDNPLEDVAKALIIWARKDEGPQVVTKILEMHPFFCKKSRKILMEWTGKQKVEQAIPVLAGLLADKDYSEDASKALQAMGPDLGATIETELAKVTPADKGQLLTQIKILGAVGTKKSLADLKKTQLVYAQKKDMVVVNACAEAIAAITNRGK
jgi:predicted Zn finger-like uncharacterized protein